MVKHSTLFHSTIGAALLSTLLLSTSAHAGLLGGGGGGGGALGGGLTGGLGPRSLNLDGQATGQANRDRTLLPSRERVTDKAGEAKSTVVDGARDRVGALRDQSGNASGSAAAGANASRDAAQRSTEAGAMAQAGGMLSRTTSQPLPADGAAPAPAAPAATTPAATSPATPAPSSATPTPSSTGNGATVGTRRTEASAGGSAQASRSERAVNADASAHGGVKRNNETR